MAELLAAVGGIPDISLLRCLDAAEASGVPLGNVYYYFKSKDELAAAVIDS